MSSWAEVSLRAPSVASGPERRLGPRAVVFRGSKGSALESYAKQREHVKKCNSSRGLVSRNLLSSILTGESVRDGFSKKCC